MQRIEVLRQKALSPEIDRTEFYYLFYKSYVKSADLDPYDRYGEAFYDAFSMLTPSISEGELIVGKCCCPLSPAEKKEWDEIYLPKARSLTDKIAVGQASHMAIDYPLVLSRGLSGIISDIDLYMMNCSAEKLPFYRSAKRCLEGAIRHAENYADYALRLAAQTSEPQRKAELLEISRICRKVPAFPAEGFYEALQSVHFITHCISINPFQMRPMQFQLGHPDRYLYPYYEKDIKENNLSEEFAQLLLDCLGIQINMRVPNGLSSGYMLGGRTEDGETVDNALTEMCLNVIPHIRLVYPAVGLLYTEGMRDSLLLKGCEILMEGLSHPAIFNDDVIQKGLRSHGVPADEAFDYIHSTCVEITPSASSNVWVASPYTNLPEILLSCLDREYAKFDDLLSVFFEKLDAHIQKNFETQNEYRKIRAQNSINPFLSCFVNDCLKKGLDIERGGARYNWIMPSFVGMANLVDSLYALRHTVFNQNAITMQDFGRILSQNFEGEEAFRLKLLALPKYGNDIDDVDSLYETVIRHITAKCTQYTAIHENGKLIPSVFCWVMHETFGKGTGATPDGRKAGFPLGDGSGPCQGRERCGPTASILSSTKWDHAPLIGGVAVNMKFSKSSLGRNSAQTMLSLLKTYLARGGFEIQINVTDLETLEKAIESPENYRDLVVRIGGYSDYFVRLSPEMQSEILLRTAHTL